MVEIEVLARTTKQVESKSWTPDVHAGALSKQGRRNRKGQEFQGFVINFFFVFSIYRSKTRIVLYCFGGEVECGVFVLFVYFNLFILFIPPRLNLLGLLQKKIGPDYANKIVIPQVQSLVRRVFGQYTPEEIYTTKRQIIETTLESAVQELGENYVSLDDLLVMSIELPPTIQNAIQSKLVQQQASEEMRFRISRETQEKERKLIEAEGIYNYNQKVRESLQSTDGNDVSSFLKFKGIDATVDLAKSPNTKVIVVGASDRMPLIMDTGAMSSPSLLPSAAPSPSAFPSPSPSSSPPAP